MTQRLSVVVPVFGNEATLVELLDRVSTAVQTIDDLDVEVIFVDDSSTDRSWSVIEAMASADPRVVGLRLASNVGQLRATCAGWAVARGDVLLSMDADLEHPPEAIPRLVRAFREGHDLVLVKRIGRSTGGVRALGSLTVNLVARVLRLPVSDVGSSFVIGTPRVAGDVRRLVERTGLQCILPTVFKSASNPTVIEVEVSTTSTSAYALRAVARQGGEFLATEAGPVVARGTLVAGGCVLVLGAHAPWRKRAVSSGALLAGLGLLGLLIPRAFRRDRDEPLYEIRAEIGRGLGPQRVGDDALAGIDHTSRAL